MKISYCVEDNEAIHLQPYEYMMGSEWADFILFTINGNTGSRQ